MPDSDENSIHAIPDSDVPPLYEGTLFGSDYVIRRGQGRIPFEPPNLNYTPHAERAQVLETLDLQRRVRDLERRNTALLIIISKILAWFAAKPMSQSEKGGYTVVPRRWWIEGEEILGHITLPTGGTEGEEPPTGSVQHPNREA